jgi:DNA-binding MarR family transcriptional regulator
MYYNLITELVDLVAIYELETDHKKEDVHLFVQWMNERFRTADSNSLVEPDWKGKSKGRSAESVINTALVHVYRYAKTIAKNVIVGSPLSTPDDLIYLITLVSQGSMTKTALLKCNIHEKSSGIQIINRLIKNGLVEQLATDSDKRNRMVHITEKGSEVLNEHMPRIKAASQQVTEPLSHQEKMDMIRLLTKLEDFHEARIS